jgi:hypothetical protein
MTDAEKWLIENELKKFKSFYDLHKFAYKKNILFDADEWEEISNKLKRLLKENKNNSIYIDTTGLILPNRI